MSQPLGLLDGVTFWKCRIPQQMLLLHWSWSATAMGSLTQGPGAITLWHHHTKKLLPLFCGSVFKCTFENITYLHGTAKETGLELPTDQTLALAGSYRTRAFSQITLFHTATDYSNAFAL